MDASSQADGQGVLGYLTGLLAQLEGAQGEVDADARQKLEALKAQLQLMEAAQARRAGSGGGAALALAGQPAAGPVEAGLHTEAAVAQELNSLEGRLASLERRLEQLDDGAKEVVQQSVAGWVGAAVGGSGEGSAGGGLGEGATT